MIPPFDAFLEEHREAVHRFLVAAVGRDEADDCFQETFLAALRAYGRLTDASNLRGWVLTIAQRKATDAHRSRRRRKLQAEAAARAVAGDAAANVAVAGGTGREPATDGITVADADVWEPVRRLPPRQRVAVLHRYVNDLAYAQIAGLMGTSEEAARQNVHAGLKRLRNGDR